jgi:hypothetical protein
VHLLGAVDCKNMHGVKYSVFNVLTNTTFTMYVSLQKNLKTVVYNGSVNKYIVIFESKHITQVV